MSVSRRGLLGGTVAAATGAAVFTRSEAAAAAGDAPTIDNYRAHVVVVGGGVGGVAAALGALRTGATVVLTEATDWIGGQFTTQLVPPDEHRWIEPSEGGLGQTATYKKLRAAVRDFYKANYPVTSGFKTATQPNPGNAWVSRLAADPAVWRAALWTLLMPYIAGGKLHVLFQHRPVAAAMLNGRVESIGFQGPDGSTRYAYGSYFVDATDLGDLLPLTKAAHTVGREKGGAQSAGGTGELNNKTPTADPMDQQAFTMVLAVGYRRTGGDYRISKPASYSTYLPIFRDFFAKNLFDPGRDYAYADGPNYWQYRRVATLSSFTPGALVEEVSLLNFACNDFKTGVLVGVDDATKAANLERGKELSLSMLYYLQNEAPRPDGGVGYRALRLRPDVSGTLDGIAKTPYVRESRRLRSLTRIFEWQVGVDNRVAVTGVPDSKGSAAQFADSVGTGHYWLDIHGGPKNPSGLWRRCYPYQIPLGALIPSDVSNLLAGGKCLGTTHVTNGAYRVHPTEWNVGESAGILAAFCVTRKTDPRTVRSSRMSELRGVLTAQGIPLSWPSAPRSSWFMPAGGRS
ncbi:FAD-dependent oxidoreductase [Actinopolymorpha alba]|uniref:FAD-dependent oxidoreductase n=1 Tax=Actinopolymorpha alba TaxID=533267 RepID=UPI0003718ACC|nr:FAD-dependent oxidoreductase [Actinopolymorpha alba]